MMKKIFVLLFGLLAAGQVFAQASGTACNNGTPIVGGIPAATQPMFIVRATPVRCSTNVTASYIQNPIAFAVGALSAKGKSYFQGDTGGGAIIANACGTTCTAGMELQGLQAKLDLAT